VESSAAGLWHEGATGSEPVAALGDQAEFSCPGRPRLRGGQPDGTFVPAGQRQRFHPVMAPFGDAQARRSFIACSGEGNTCTSQPTPAKEDAHDRHSATAAARSRSGEGRGGEGR
jgi:hypothetical protein